MSTLKNRATKVVALVLTLALTQVYVYADLTKAATARLVGAVSAPQAQGRLTTRGDNPITVAGNSAKTGETVFSGQQIQTPDGVGATVDLGPLGRVDIAPNTDLTLTFEGGRINIIVTRGCVVVHPTRGTPATVETGGRVISKPDGGERIDTCPDDVGAGAIVPQVIGPAGTAAGISTGAVVAGAIGFVALVTAAAILPCDGPSDPSPTLPNLDERCD